MSPNHTVLVTGINGFIGSHVADQFLHAGYNVRGTARTLTKADTIKKVLTEKHGAGRLEITTVPDMAVDGAFNEAVKGVHAVAHVATILTLDKDPNNVIPPVKAAVTGILQSCLKEPTIKSFIFTSSSTAACSARANIKRHITSDSWNEEEIRDAWKPESERKDGHEWTVYGASKTEAEKVLWKFRDEEKPKFTVNAVLPATNFGPVLSPDEVSSTANLVRAVYNGKVTLLQGINPQYYVDVRDVARLHVAPVLYPDVDGRRLFAWNNPYNWNTVLRVLRGLRPKHEFSEDIADPGEDINIVENAEAEKLLVRMGQQGWVLTKEMFEDSLKSYGY